MKITLLILAVVCSMVSSASALEPLNCLQWAFSTENDFVTAQVSDRTAKDVLESGREFGFTLEEKVISNTNRTHYYRYDRSLVIDDEVISQKYEERMRTIDWHMNSRLGFHFYCSFYAPVPQPRISGSN